MAGMIWFKHMTDMHCNHKIRALRRMEHGNDFALIFTMLLEIAGRCGAGGKLFLTEKVSYTAAALADELGYDEKTVADAIAALEAFGLVSAKKGLRITTWGEYQATEKTKRERALARGRAAAYRERKRAASLAREASESGDYDAESEVCDAENEARGVEAAKCGAHGAEAAASGACGAEAAASGACGAEAAKNGVCGADAKGNGACGAISGKRGLETSVSGAYDSESGARGAGNEACGGADDTPSPTDDGADAGEKCRPERHEDEPHAPSTDGKDEKVRLEKPKVDSFAPPAAESGRKRRSVKPKEEPFKPTESEEGGKRRIRNPDDEVFTPPDLEEVKKYREERKSAVDAERFVDYYASVGWKVGRNPMRDWKAAFRRWENSGGTDGGGSYGGAPYQARVREKYNPALDYPQRAYDDDEFRSGDYIREAEEFMKRQSGTDG